MNIRRTKLIERDRQVRDARLFVIATEDTYVAEQYFEALERNEVYDRRRVRLLVLPTIDNRADPAHVLDRLAAFSTHWSGADERWLCVDVDDRRDKELSGFCSAALSRGFQVAVSNPCFEAWLLLHLEADPPPRPCESCEKRLRALLGTYDKTHLQPEPWTTGAVAKAVAHARALDVEPANRWPQTPGSHLYRLLASLLEHAPAPPA